MSPESKQIFEFADFRLDLSEKILLREGEAVALTPKAFDTLAVLVENAGRLMEKDELMRKIWQDRFVEEGNLAFNVKVLRKALGDNAAEPQFIETVQRRGYRFIAEVRRIQAEQKAERNSAEATNNDLFAEASLAPRFSSSPQVVALADWRREPTERKTTENAPQKPQLELVPPVKRDAPKTLRNFFRWLAAALILLTVFGSGWYLLRSREAAISSLENRSAVRLTANGRTKSAAVSPDGRFVAYITDEDGRQSIRLKNIPTESDLEILTAAENSALGNLVFTPDGNQIYYSNLGAVYQISILGGTPKKLLTVGGNGFALAPDGKKFAFIRYSQGSPETTEIVVAETDGGGERVVATSRRPEIFLRSPAWSPDGEKIACAALNSDGTQKVVVARAADGAVESLSAPPWEIVYQVVWQKSSDALLVLATKGDDIFFTQIWSLSYPTGEARNLTGDTNNYQSISLTADGQNLVAVRLEQTAHLWVAPADDYLQAKQITDGFDKFDGIYALDWTTDGKIIYETAPNGQSALWTIAEDGRDARQVAAGTFATDAAADGDFAVFQGENGTGLFRLNLRDGERKRLTTGQDIWATISPDKKSVIFTRYSDDVALWKIAADGGDAVKLTSAAGYPLVPTVSPNGRWVAFYLTQNRAKTPPQLAVISIDGGEILKSFDAPVQHSQNFWKTALQWSPDGEALDFVVFKEGVSNIWRQPINGDAPFQLTNFSDRRIFNFAYAPDGKRLALSRGTFNRDVFLIKNQ